MPKQTPSMSDEAVRAKTGKGWDDWFTLLDAAGARAMPHKEIVALLSGHEVGPWWRQMVTVAYEQARGMREKHQTPSGFTANASRTIGVPVEPAVRGVERRGPPPPLAAGRDLTVRKATPDKSLRITWQDGSNVDVDLFPKGEHRRARSPWSTRSSRTPKR